MCLARTKVTFSAMCVHVRACVRVRARVCVCVMVGVLMTKY